MNTCNNYKHTEEAATHQFELHDAHTVPKDVRGCPQQLCEGIQSVVFEGRTSNLERGQQKMDQWNNNTSAGMCSDTKHKVLFFYV